MTVARMYKTEGQECIVTEVIMYKLQEELRMSNDRGQKVKCTKVVFVYTHGIIIYFSTLSIFH